MSADAVVHQLRDRRSAGRRASPPTPVEIDWELDGPFSAGAAGVALDRSMDGFSMVVVGVWVPRPGQRLRMRPADLPPLLAEVRWVRRLDRDTLKVGCSFVTEG